ncbi:alkane 1-monooxygenase [Rhodobacterales bacterium 56_14_T64]|nr:alkane 1-monooxygenase [Rhodobacterales bacterium 56_14_T64]
MIWFAIASLSPLVLLAAACLWGGLWPLLALLYMSVLVVLLDQIARHLQTSTAGPGADLLSGVLALGHLALLLAGLRAIAYMPWGEALPMGLAMGLFMGQVSHPNAHEMIHHPHRWMRRLGMVIYTSMLIGHHVSAHLRVHHVKVATARDPNTARRGEGFYRFFLRAWLGSFRAGLRADNAARARKSPLPATWTHPYLGYFGGAAGALALIWIGVGLQAIFAYVLIAGFAQSQIFLADYVQHYGLVRAVDETGRAEPVGATHSWNAPHWYSSAMMLNAPRHSDHHLHPKRRYPELQLHPDMPVLPYSLAVMAAIALVPPLWRRMMARRLAQLGQSDPMA